LSLEAVIGLVALIIAVVALFLEVRSAAREAEEREAERIKGAAHMIAQGVHLQAVRLNHGEALLSAPRYVIGALRARLPEQVRTVDDLRGFLEDNPWMADVVTAEGWMRSPLTKQMVDEMQRLLNPARDMSGGWGFVAVAIQRLSMLATGTGESEAVQAGKLRSSLDPWDNSMAKLPWVLKAQLDPKLNAFANHPASEPVGDAFFKVLEREMCSVAAGVHRARPGKTVEEIASLLGSTARHIDQVDARRIVAIARENPQAQGPNSAKEQMQSCAPVLEEHGQASLAKLVRKTAAELDAISEGAKDSVL
jgi:hypothetical protein